MRPASRSRSIRSPTPHCTRPSSSTGRPSETSSPSSTSDDLEPLAQELLDRVLEEGDQRGELDVAARARAARGRPATAGADRGRAAARAPASAAASKENGRRGLEVLRVEGLQRVVAQRALLAAGHGGVEGVEQLAERYGGRPRLARRLVGAGVGDDEVLGRRDDRVEHQLAVLAARVALAGERAAGEHVVAVDRAGAREDAVVETEQADHAVRDRAHRHQGGHGQRAGAEVGAGRATGEALPHQRAYVGQPQLERRTPPSASTIEASSRCTWAVCHSSPARDRGQRLDPLAHVLSQWPTGWLPVRSSVTRCSRSRHSASRPARSMLVLPDVVERQGGAEEAVGVVADRHPGEDAVEAEAPGVLHVALEPERLAVVGVEGPADAGALHPAGDRLEVGVGEAEAATHRARPRAGRAPGSPRPARRRGRAAGRRRRATGWSGSATGRPAGPGARGPGGGRCRPSRRRRRSAARRTRCPGTSP